MITKLFQEKWYITSKSLNNLDIFYNPSISEIKKELEDWNDISGIRGLLTYDGKDLYVWDAYLGTHQQVIDLVFRNEKFITIYFGIKKRIVFLTITSLFKDRSKNKDKEELKEAKIIKNSIAIYKLFGNDFEIYSNFNGKFIDKDIL